MVFQHIRHIVESAELIAGKGEDRDVFHLLRKLSIYDFGMLMLGMPDEKYPALSGMLPRMAAPDIQTAWAGSHGFDLFRKTADFIPRLEYYSTKYRRSSLLDSRILDFGCGFGRLTRMMLYFTGPKNIFAVDPWDRSIDICKADGVPGHLAVSSYLPDILPVGNTKMDFVTAYSVFTHTSLRATTAALRAIRKCIAPTGLLVITVRPIEFFNEPFHSQNSEFSKDKLINAYTETGFAFYGKGFAKVDEDDVYGDAVINPEWFEREGTGWRLLAYDRGMDLTQTILILGPD